MANQSTTQPFIWGQGGTALTPEQVRRQREIADLLVRSGSDYSPVEHWLQGAARLTQGGLGGLLAYRSGENERAGREAFTSRPEYASLFGGAGAAAAIPPQNDQVAADSPALAAVNAVAEPASSGTGGGGWLNYANTGATRNRPISPELEAALSFLPELGVTMEVFSGGQPGIGEGGGRVGSTRHDHGNAADVFFYRDGRQLDWANPDDLPIFEEIVRRGRASGVTGFGAGEGYMRPGSMHIGFGPEAVWGAGGSGENAPDWLRNAFAGAPAGTAPSGVGGVPMQQPQAPQQQAGYDIASLLSLASDPWANDSERQILQALIGQQMQQQAQANDPLRQLQIQQAQLQLNQAQNPFRATPATPEQLAEWGIQPQPGESWTIGQDGLPQQVYGPSSPEIPSAFQTLSLRAEAAGLMPGTPEYQEFMAAGGAAGANSAAEATISRLMELGYGRDQAIRMSDQYVLGQDETGRSVLIDRATGRQADPILLQGQAPTGQVTSGDLPLLPGTQAISPITGAPMTVPQQPGSFPQMEQAQPQGAPNYSTLPEGTNIEAALGLGGTVAGGLNTIVDSIFGNAPIEEQTQAANALQNIRLQTNQALLQGFSGRTNVYTQQMIDELAVTPGMPPTAARDRFAQTLALVDQEMARLQDSVLSNPTAWTPQEVRDATASYSALSSLADTYRAVLGSISEREEQRNQTRPPLETYWE